MDLTLSDEQRLLRESADRFVAKNCKPEHSKKATSEPLGFSMTMWSNLPISVGWRCRSSWPMAASAAAPLRSNRMFALVRTAETERQQDGISFIQDRHGDARHHHPPESASDPEGDADGSAGISQRASLHDLRRLVGNPARHHREDGIGILIPVIPGRCVGIEPGTSTL